MLLYRLENCFCLLAAFFSYSYYCVCVFLVGAFFSELKYSLLPFSYEVLIPSCAMQLELIYSYMEYGGISGCYVREREREREEKEKNQEEKRKDLGLLFPPSWAELNSFF